MERPKEPNPKTRKKEEERLKVCIVTDSLWKQHRLELQEQLDHLCGELEDPIILHRAKSDDKAVEEWADWHWLLRRVHYNHDDSTRVANEKMLEDADFSILCLGEPLSKEMKDMLAFVQNTELEHRVVQLGDE